MALNQSRNLVVGHISGFEQNQAVTDRSYSFQEQARILSLSPAGRLQSTSDSLRGEKRPEGE